MARVRLSSERLTTQALLLRSVPVREADLIVTLYTEGTGAIAAVARAARKSRRRFVGLEPLHLLRVTVEQVAGRDLATLTEAMVARPRLGLISALGPLQAAGRALRWLRAAAPTCAADAGMWVEINRLLDALDAAPGDEQVNALLGAGGLRLLAAAGWGLELECCVRCGRICPSDARATVDVQSGGVVCRACGGQGIMLSAACRRTLRAAMRGEPDALSVPAHAKQAIDLADQALRVHAGASLR